MSSGSGMAEAKRTNGSADDERRLPFRSTIIRWTLGYWVFIYLLFTLRSLVIPYDMLLVQGLLRLVMMGAGLALCALLFLFLERIAPADLPRKIIPVAAVAAAATLAYVGANYYLFYVVPGIFEPDQAPIAMIGFYAIQFLWLFPAWIGLYYWLRSRRERAGRLAQSEAIRDLWIKDRGTAMRVPVDAIHWLEAEGDYVRVYTAERSYLMRTTMRNMEGSLDPTSFIRIHRSVIASTDLISAIERQTDGRVEVLLSTGAKLPAGRRYLPRLKELGRDG